MSDNQKDPEKANDGKSTWKEKFNFSDWDRKTWLYVSLFLAIMVFTVILGYLWMRNTDIFYEWIIRYFVIPISKMEFWGIVLFLVFMAIQSLLMPIPSEVVLLAAGIIWGFWGGFVLGMVVSLFSAILCYFIAAKGGGPIVEKFLGKEQVEIVDVYLQKYGAPFVFVMRAVPFIGFDPVSYVSGLVKLDFKKYFLANLFGCISRCIFYAWLGNELTGGLDLITSLSEEELELLISEGAGDFNKIIIIILATLISFAVLYNWVLIPYLKKRRDRELEEMSEEEKKQLQEKLEPMDEAPEIPVD